jgi:TolA-binding protein
MPRHLFKGFFAAAAIGAFLFLLRLVWSPDPAQNLFARAQKLEAAGQIPAALDHYALISDTHPESFYAPRSLLRQGDILAAQGRQDDDKTAFKQAVTAYARLAKTYTSDPLSTEALLDAGQISAENLGDRAAAKGFYNQLLEKAGRKSDTAATATVKLGRLALEERDGKTAQKLLQLVLQQWPNLRDRAAEAQFHLGVAYETLFKNKEWATRAYQTTVDRYPSSTWANDAKGRLGLIIFTETKGHRPARRVFIDIEALPDDGQADGSLWATLRPILAARGVEADDATLRGWSLAPFYTGFDSGNPSRVVRPSFDAFENVLANAGLRYTIKSGGTEAKALSDLQDEIDAARPPLVYIQERGQGSWSLVVGYDSDRGEVMLQKRGARFDTLNVKSFASYWKAKSSLGGIYTLISIVPTGKTRPAPSLTPAPTPTTAPGATPLPALFVPPTFTWELPRIAAKEADARALSRAATLLLRPREGGVTLNAEGLNTLASELSRLARVPAISAIPVPEPTLEPTPEVAPPGENPESPYSPDSTPAPTPAPVVPTRSDARDDTPRAQALLGFFGAPIRQWILARREAATWCDAAANRANNPNLKKAATALRQSATALEEAILLAPSITQAPLGPGDRTQLAEAARQIEKARDAEREASRLMR